LSVFGHATGHTMYVGRGAGQMPTASAVVSDLMNIAAGWYPRAFADLNLWCNDHEPPHRIPGEQLTTRFYMRISALDGPGVMAKVGTILGDKGISASALLQHEMKAGQFVPVVIVTHEASQGAMSDALDEIEKLDVVDGRPVCIRIIDLPEG
ncbi:MAG: homoserine dehydrogenase, partial [Phycisphaeraceae bacterium]|nr:homoserine dehydrogenase [Phycisphaeraceae bacterium]